MYFKRTVLPIIVVIMLLIPLSVWGLAPSYPTIYIQTPLNVNIPPGDASTIIISVFAQEAFEGKVQLTVEDVPDGVTVAFNPNPVNVPAFSQGDVSMTISTTSSVSTGSASLTIVGTSIDKFLLAEGNTYVKKLTPLIFTIGKPVVTTSTTQTSTSSISTSQTSTVEAQEADNTLLIIVIVAVIAIIAVAAVVLRRRK